MTRCPACESVVAVPVSSSIPRKKPGSDEEVDESQDRSLVQSGQLNIRTAGWLLYLGILTAASILWGTLATGRLRERTRQMEEAIRRADEAEKAAKATTERAEFAAKTAIERAEEIKGHAIEKAEIIMRDAETIREHARVTREKAEEIRVRVDEKLRKQYPLLHKLVPGENAVRDKYLDSLTIENGVVHLKLRNTSDSRIKPNFIIAFFDDTATETDRADISWIFTSIEPGETSSDETRINPNFAPPVYYTLSFRDQADSAGAGERQSVGPFLTVGDQAIVQGEGHTRVFLATSDSAWYEMLDAESTKSAELMARLIQQGKVIAPKGGTRCLIVKIGLLSKLVRIKEGPYAGQEGWIQSELVKPFKGD